MSLMEPLLRFLDSIAHRQLEADRRRARDTRANQPDPEPSVLVPPLPSATTMRRQCRICGQIDATQFCLVCLADTMEDAP